MDPLTAFGAVLGSFLLGKVKKHTTALDGKIGRFVKPLQPLLVAAAGIGLPYASEALNVATVDPTAFVTAPLMTLALITTRESWARISGRK